MLGRAPPRCGPVACQTASHGRRRPARRRAEESIEVDARQWLARGRFRLRGRWGAQYRNRQIGMPGRAVAGRLGRLPPAEIGVVLGALLRIDKAQPRRRDFIEKLSGCFGVRSRLKIPYERALPQHSSLDHVQVSLVRRDAEKLIVCRRTLVFGNAQPFAVRIEHP